MTALIESFLTIHSTFRKQQCNILLIGFPIISYHTCSLLDTHTHILKYRRRQLIDSTQIFESVQSSFYKSMFQHGPSDATDRTQHSNVNWECFKTFWKVLNNMWRTSWTMPRSMTHNDMNQCKQVRLINTMPAVTFMWTTMWENNTKSENRKCSFFGFF